MISVGAVIVILAGIIIGSKVRQNQLIANHNFEITEEQTPETEEGSYKVIATAENENEAREIAELYGIELIDYSYKVAVYLTDKNPVELVKWGKEKGYPSIAVNQKYTVN